MDKGTPKLMRAVLDTGDFPKMAFIKERWSRFKASLASKKSGNLKAKRKCHGKEKCGQPTKAGTPCQRYVPCASHSKKPKIKQNEGAGNFAEQEGGKGDTDHESSMPTIHNVYRTYACLKKGIKMLSCLLGPRLRQVCCLFFLFWSF